MRNFITIFLIVLGAVTFNGCSLKNNNPYNTIKWINEPHLNGYIVGLGIAPKNKGDDIALQRSEAMALARDDIARQIETKVGGFLDKFAEETGEGESAVYARDVKQKLRTVVKMKLRGARTKKSWMGDNNLYLLMSLETKKVLNMLKITSEKSNLQSVNTKFQRFLSQKNQQELEKELERYDK